MNQGICISQNMRSLQANFKALEEFLDRQQNCMIIALQEIWRVTTPPKIKGFQPLYFKTRNFHKTRSNNQYGGVAIYVREGLKFQHLNVPFTEQVFEAIGITIKTKVNEIQIINIYSHPNTDKETFFNYIDMLPISNTKKTILLGDMNFDIMKPENMDVKQRGMGGQNAVARR